GATGSTGVTGNARAAVLLYDDPHKQWVPAGGGPQTLSCVQLYHHPGTHGFRLVGRKMQPDQQVVLNCPLGRGLRYSAVTPQFHQWREARRVWGLSFGAPREATAFADAVLWALRALDEGDKRGVPHTMGVPTAADTPPNPQAAAGGPRASRGGRR
uniref:WH1 domain-containing protein n=1 Tax=Strigops habroptila TaxID=2489341 RepID=A0A672V652_STRHB